jgi:uncharacterized protein with PIN domain
MRSVEVHLIESNDDIDLGLLAGLLDPEDLTDDLRCSACSDELGNLSVEEFVEFVAILDDKRTWFLCTTCSDDVLNGYRTSNEVGHPLFVDDLDDLADL